MSFFSTTPIKTGESHCLLLSYLNKSQPCVPPEIRISPPQESVLPMCHQGNNLLNPHPQKNGLLETDHPQIQSPPWQKQEISQRQTRIRKPPARGCLMEGVDKLGRISGQRMRGTVNPLKRRRGKTVRCRCRIAALRYENNAITTSK